MIIRNIDKPQELCYYVIYNGLKIKPVLILF